MTTPEPADRDALADHLNARECWRRGCFLLPDDWHWAEVGDALKDRHLAHLAEWLAARDRRVKAEALREAGDEADSIGQRWSGAPALAFFALAGDFRDRADQIDNQGDA